MDNAAPETRRATKRPNVFEPGIGGGQGRRKEDELEGKRAKLGGPATSTSQDSGAEKMVPISSVLGKLLQVVVELQAGKQKLRDKASELEGAASDALTAPPRDEPCTILVGGKRFRLHSAHAVQHTCAHHD